MTPPGPAVRYATAGSYDAHFETAVSADGTLTTEGGTYVTQGRRTRGLRPAERADLARLAAAVEAPAAFPVPALADGFTATLTVDGRTVQWWGPPPTSALAALVAWLDGRRG